MHGASARVLMVRSIRVPGRLQWPARSLQYLLEPNAHERPASGCRCRRGRCPGWRDGIQMEDCLDAEHTVVEVDIGWKRRVVFTLTSTAKASRTAGRITRSLVRSRLE